MILLLGILSTFPVSINSVSSANVKTRFSSLGSVDPSVDCVVDDRSDNSYSRASSMVIVLPVILVKYDL